MFATYVFVSVIGVLVLGAAILGPIVCLVDERNKHRDRATSMYQFIQEVRAMDKYLEWEGLRQTKKDRAALALEYSEYNSPEEPHKREWVA